VYDLNLSMGAQSNYSQSSYSQSNYSEDAERCAAMVTLVLSIIQVPKELFFPVRFPGREFTLD